MKNIYFALLLSLFSFTAAQAESIFDQPTVQTQPGSGLSDSDKEYIKQNRKSQQIKNNETIFDQPSVQTQPGSGLSDSDREYIEKKTNTK